MRRSGGPDAGLVAIILFVAVILLLLVTAK
jgi:hypothetical protein